MWAINRAFRAAQPRKSAARTNTGVTGECVRCPATGRTISSPAVSVTADLKLWHSYISGRLLWPLGPSDGEIHCGK